MIKDTKRIVLESLKQYKSACEDAIKYDNCKVSLKELPLVNIAIEEVTVLLERVEK